MKIGYIIPAYFGIRNKVHSKLNTDTLYYVNLQLEYIKKSIIPIDKIYIICTFDGTQNRDFIISELNKIAENNKNISVNFRDNLGGSYCSWKMALDIDSNECDYIILSEDDYVIYDANSVNHMLDYFKNDFDLFYLCQYWNTQPYYCAYYNQTIPAHAALSIGMINNKLYNQYKNSYNIDFKLSYDSGYLCMNANQASFLENYRLKNVKIQDWRDKFSSYYPHSDVDFGQLKGTEIFRPIIDKFFN